MSGFRLPDDTHRITIIGKTGSGKTQAGAWVLSHRSFDKRPWIILDFKRDDLIGDIPHTKKLDVEAAIPKKPGLYLCQPRPDQKDEVEEFLWRIWTAEDTGLYIDEGYMIDDRSPAFQAILTQGRSKHIPVMTLTQRPAWITRFVFSEADFIQLFRLTDDTDMKRVKQFMPIPIAKKPLPMYHSYWYDNSANYGAVMSPVPDRTEILKTFHERGKVKRRVF